MSAISTILIRLRAAIWARDVRDDIANAIEQCYSDVSNPTLQTEALEAALQEKIDQGEMAALTIGDHTITAAKLAQGVIDNTLTTSGAAADAAETGRQFGLIKADLEQMDPGLSVDARDALVAVLQRMVYTVPRANDYYNALVSELYAEEYPKITAVFNPGTHNVYEGDSLDSLKPYLTVKYYVDASSSGTIVNDYTLSGTIEEGVQFITVRCYDYRTTFTVSVTNPFIYRLMNTPVTVDGVTPIDTDVAMLSENRSFTIACDYVDNINYTKAGSCWIFGCYTTASPYKGIFFQNYDGGSQESGTARKVRMILRCTPPGASGGQTVFDVTLPNEQVPGRRVRFCLAYDSTNGTVTAKCAVNGTVITPTLETINFEYVTLQNPLIVGGSKTSIGYGEVSNAVFYDFKVFDSAMSANEMQAYIEEVE